MFSAKNELFHLCAEATETGDVGPLLDDVLLMLEEDVLDSVDLFSTEGCAAERHHRSLREARTHRATTFRGKSRINHRGQRSLRKTHPAAHSLRSRAPRARHLRYNHFTRPSRRRLNGCSTTELLDGLYLKGGWDGSQVFIKLELDISKESLEDARQVILKPLELLRETYFLQELNLVSGGASVMASSFDGIDADISFSSDAHMGVKGEKIHSM